MPIVSSAALSPDATTWRRAVRSGLLAYAFSRLCVLVGAALVAAELRADENKRLAEFPLARWADPYWWDRPIPRHAARPMLDVLTSWDGLWYLRLVRNGYPTAVRPDVTYEIADARAAFFPLYPAVVRMVDAVLPGRDVAAALAVNVVLGALTVVLAGTLARAWFGVDAARPAMVVVAMFPGSFVLSFAYTEALLLVLACGCMLALHRHQWPLAGVLAAAGTATRPNGAALILACAVAAAVAIARRREWGALIAPVVAPLGIVLFLLWLGRHTGEPGVWFRVQREAWGEGASFGMTALRRTGRALVSPLTSPTNVITAVSLATTGFLAWTARRMRPPLEAIAYSAGVLLLMLLPATVTARPRFVFTALPLIVIGGVWLDRRRPEWWTIAMAASAVGLTALTTLYGVYGAIP